MEKQVLVVLGCLGDLSLTKIYPALFRLYNAQTLDDIPIVGVARNLDIGTGDVVSNFSDLVSPYLGAGDATGFKKQLHFVQGDSTAAETYTEIDAVCRKIFGSDDFNRIFYFAIPPTVFLDTINVIPKRMARVVLEKPLGKDLESAQVLTSALSQFGERNVFMLDHFLGRKMVENIRVIRFMNALLEPLWRKEHVSAVVIACREKSLPKPGTALYTYFEDHGIVRDIIVDHLVNIVQLICMEPPASLSDKDVWDQKYEVLKKIKVLDTESSQIVLGKCKDYKGKQPTFATVVLEVDTDRWRGVPIILKAGKGVNEKRTDIRIQLKKPMFSGFECDERKSEQNTLTSVTARLRETAPQNEIVIRVQPNEDVYVKVVAGSVGGSLIETKLDFLSNETDTVSASFTKSPYEHLISDVINGKRDAFMDSKQLMARWKIFSTFVNQIDTIHDSFIPYELGSRGPCESDDVMASRGYVRQDKIESELIGVKESNTLNILQSKFLLSADKCQEIIADFYREMEDGLNCKPSSLKMLPSFVTHLPDGSEEGVFYALDIGGTNFRVTRFSLDGKGKCELTDERKFTIPDPVMVADNPEALFDFLAECIQTVKGEEGEKRRYGFTFSFPTQQLALDKGKLINWTKGFTTKGVEGNEVVGPLKAALAEANFQGDVVALVNDTVGTLAAGAYMDPSCVIGIILGTGTNAAYTEKVENIKSLPEDIRNQGGDMVVNMEWGAFGDRRKMLPVTEVDAQLDEQSRNPKQQSFEKMISGFYLGEIGRLCLVQLFEAKEIFTTENTIVPDDLYVPYSFKSWYLSDIEYDLSKDHRVINKVLTQYGIHNATANDIAILKEVSGMVIERAARLTSCAIVATLKHLNKPIRECSVGIDGSVFQHHPSFKQRLDKALASLGYDCPIFLSKDGSGKGAALIASGACS